jgi:hypothetical protein
MKIAADIDIDLANRDQVLQLIQYTAASQRKNDQLTRHNSGVYVTDIPKDTLHGYASIDYQQAEQRGYFKIDLLNNSVYQLIRDQQHYDDMLTRTPPWARLLDRDFVGKIVHINNAWDQLQRMPEPVDTLARMAMFIAVIRPAKRYLQGRPWAEVAQHVWAPELDGYYFKKSHSIAYAHLVALHMNLVQSLDQGN